MNNSKNEKVLKVVSRAIQSFNEQLPADRRLVPSPKCELVGSPNLDSSEIVSLMVAIEQQVEQDLGISVTLFDAIGQFISVETVVEFIVGKMPGEDTAH